jgi:hypothetical protein
VPAVLGAVYEPDEEIVPPVAVQITDVLLVPVTVAENCCVDPVWRVIVVGEIESATVAISGAVELAAVTPPQPMLIVASASADSASKTEYGAPANKERSC